MAVSCRVEQLAGAPDDLVVFVAHDRRCAATVAGGDRPDDPAVTALAFVLIIDSAERFACGEQIASYVGLIPREDSSADRQRLGHITKQGNSLASIPTRGVWSLLGGSARVRKIRYAVAMSLDGYIAGPNGEYDWIGTDSEVDFAAFWTQFDTLLMGRRTFGLAVQARGEAAFTAFPGVTSIVFSRNLKQQEHPYVSVVPELNADLVRDLKAQSGKDIWLFGGSSLFRSFFDSGLVEASKLLSYLYCWGPGFRDFPLGAALLRLKLEHDLSIG